MASSGRLVRRLFWIVVSFTFHLFLTVNPLAFHSNVLTKRTFVPPRSQTLLFSSTFEYEFLPFDDDDEPEDAQKETSSSSSVSSSTWHNLPSSYPPRTPAGLRGEAVRSALLSDSRCVAWKHHPSSNGLIQFQGRGVMDFLQAKLTKSFSVDNLGPISSNSGGGTDGIMSTFFTRACLLNAKGQVVDGLSVAIIAMDDKNNDDPNHLILDSNHRRDDDDDMKAWWLTSMGYDSRPSLGQQLDSMIFPLDQVQVQHVHATIFTLASTQLSVVQKVIRTQVLPFLQSTMDKQKDTNPFIFPHYDQCGYYEIPTSAVGGGSRQALLLLPTTGLPPSFCVGYTLCCWNTNTTQRNNNDLDVLLGQQLWNHLTSDANSQGPIAVGRLEYESLRVQAGQPEFGYEYQASLVLRRPKKRNNSQSDDDDSEKAVSPSIPPSPLELHMQDQYLDLDRKEGCYLGQEGLASILKNPRGPPRLLYQVIFDDDANVYDEKSPTQRRRRKHQDNWTKYPQVGDKLYVLGSNEQIWVGTITSVAEPNGTGEANTVALCLVRRADSIISSMKEMDLEMDQLMDLEENEDMGFIAPPPMDPLHGLEVIIGGTYTIGLLQSIPSRRVGPGQNWLEKKKRESRSGLSSSRGRDGDDDDDFRDGFINIQRTRSRFANDELLEQMTRMSTNAASRMNAPVVDVDQVKTRGGSLPVEDDREDEEASFQLAMEEAEKAQKEAEAAAAEAQRKAEKMEQLKKRAEEAMARRKSKQPTTPPTS
jgi:hypothetical protein